MKSRCTKPPPPSLNSRRRPRAAADLRRKFVSGQFDEENPFVLISSVLLVQPDKGVSVLVMDRIGDYLPQSTEKSRVLVIPVGARHKCQQVAIQEARSYEESQAGLEQRRRSAGAQSVYDISCDVVIQQGATVISRKIQQMSRDALNMHMKQSTRDDATSCWRFSRWISVDDVIGDVIIFSRCFEKTVARISRYLASRRKRKRRRKGDIQSQATVHQQMLFGDSDSKTMSFT
ncbi:hypothetical protein F511_11966 [Dorcoceras hygrometricum]|uniref:Uncharacterized protein n=1 Tax=Dorcoceras hygrometricum TaxID=472368 RepID=A0A2Z7CJ26_9LAMI|nr:hypothetical protein F511_11966 [Dorcoceras hygrometricum]